MKHETVLGQVRHLLEKSYPIRWTSADVRESNCSLDMCHDFVRQRPDRSLIRRAFQSVRDAEILYHPPEMIWGAVFGRWDAPGRRMLYHNCPTPGKLDGHEAQILWDEWKIRRGIKYHTETHVGEFLAEVGLPIFGEYGLFKIKRAA